jgi:glycosyltransferase involved in cell wall biosynthesis
MSLKVSVVIRCYNEAHHIGRLLDGIANQTVSGVDVVVVDSGSTDGTLEVASRYPVRVVQIRPEEFSFGRSLNCGCEAASGDVIVIASAHVYPIFQDWIEQMIAPFADRRVGLVYGRQSGAETSNYAECQLFRRWYPAESNLAQDHPFCNNANAAIRRALWQQVPYDEMLTGLEDLAWARRVMELGYRIAYVAGAEVIHLHSESWKSVYNRYRREAIALKRIFPEERFSLIDFIRLCAANTAADWRHAWAAGSLLRHVTSIFEFRLMQFWGTYRGFNGRGAVTAALRQRLYYPQQPGVPRQESEPYARGAPAPALRHRR